MSELPPRVSRLLERDNTRVSFLDSDTPNQHLEDYRAKEQQLSLFDCLESRQRDSRLSQSAKRIGLQSYSQNTRGYLYSMKCCTLPRCPSPSRPALPDILGRARTPQPRAYSNVEFIHREAMQPSPLHVSSLRGRMCERTGASSTGAAGQRGDGGDISEAIARLSRTQDSADCRCPAGSQYLQAESCGICRSTSFSLDTHSHGSSSFSRAGRRSRLVGSARISAADGPSLQPGSPEHSLPAFTASQAGRRRAPSPLARRKAALASLLPSVQGVSQSSSSSATSPAPHGASVRAHAGTHKQSPCGPSITSLQSDR